MKEKILLSWSGGKDSAMALYEVSRGGHHDVAALLTTVTDAYDRISMHGVRRTLHKIYISKSCVNQEYESKMGEALAIHQKNGVECVAFGDIFLEDLRKYREENLAKQGMKGLFPIWRRDTRELVRTFIQLGFQAIVVCVDSKVLGPSFAGKLVDHDFLKQLPGPVDPCGENGEFHSFVFDGPISGEEIRFSVGEVVFRDSFYFCELLPA